MSDRPTSDAPPAGHSGTLRVAASVAIVASAWCALALLIWNLNRGFDFSDEATLLYLYRHPDSFLDRLYLQHFRLVGALTPPAFDHIVTYRLFKLLALVGFTALFALALVKWLARRAGVMAPFFLHPVVLFHFLLTGSFLAYCHGAQTLSYNDLVTLCLLAAAAACFALDLAPAGANALAWRLMVSLPIGATIALLLAIKWPSAPLLAGYYLAFVGLVASDRSARALGGSLGGAAAGAALTLVATSDVGFGTMFSFSRLFAVLSDRAGLETHADPFALLAMYATDSLRRLVDLAQSPAVAALALPVAAMVARAFSDGSRRSRLALRVLAVAALLALVIFLVQAPGWALHHRSWFHRYRIADLQTFAFVFAGLGACCCLFTLRDRASKRAATILLAAALLLAGLPVAGAIGTDNPLLIQFIRHMAPLFAALAIAVAVLGFAGRWRPFAPAACAAAALLSVAQLAFVVLLHPYRLQQPGLRQTTALAAPPHMAGLKVDAPTAAFIGRLLAQAQRAVGDTARMPMLALFDMPGVVYILDGLSVGYPWHSASSSEKIVCARVRSDPLGRTAQLLLLDRDAVSPSLTECLREGAIDLSRYEEVARIGNLNGTASGRSLRLLIPRTN